MPLCVHAESCLGRYNHIHVINQRSNVTMNTVAKAPFLGCHGNCGATVVKLTINCVSLKFVTQGVCADCCLHVFDANGCFFDFVPRNSGAATVFRTIHLKP